jgi:hypothetical protein
LRQVEDAGAGFVGHAPFTAEGAADCRVADARSGSDVFDGDTLLVQGRSSIGAARRGMCAAERKGRQVLIGFTMPKYLVRKRLSE